MGSGSFGKVDKKKQSAKEQTVFSYYCLRGRGEHGGGRVLLSFRLATLNLSFRPSRCAARGEISHY